MKPKASAPASTAASASSTLVRPQILTRTLIEFDHISHSAAAPLAERCAKLHAINITLNRRGPHEYSGPRLSRPQRVPKANGLLKNSPASGHRRGCGQNARGPLRPCRAL